MKAQTHQVVWRSLAVMCAGMGLVACAVVQPAAASYQRGLEQYQQGDYEAAIDELDLALARDDEMGEAYAIRGMAHFHLDHPAEAMDDLDRAVELGAADGEVLAARGMLRLASGDSDAALQDFNLAVQQGYSVPEVFGQRGILLQQAGQDDLALVDLNQAIELGSTDPSVFYTLALIFNQRGEQRAALENLDQAIEMDGQYAAALALRGQVQYGLHNLDEALVDLDAAIALNYELGMVHYTRGLIIEDRDGKVAALDDFTRAIELGPEDAQVHVHRGLAYLETGALQEALDDFTRAIELDPENAEAYAERALLYTAVGEEQLALDDFARAFELGLDNRDLYETRGDIYYTQGEYALAAADYAHYLNSATSPVITADTFEPPRTLWPTNQTDDAVQFGYREGQYEIRVLKPYHVAELWGETTYGRDDIIIDVDTVFDADPGYEYSWGVMCRWEDSNSYSFLISSRGTFAIIRQRPSGSLVYPTFLRGWESANVINTEPGARNHITASCIGDTLTLEVNGNFLAQVTDDSLASGTYAMTAYTNGSVENRILFDNLIVRSERPEIGAQRRQFVEQPARRVLVVCDNFLPANDEFCSAAAIEAALDRLGYESEITSTLEGGIPTVDALDAYDVVFWSLGDDCCDSPHADSVEVIQQYLDRGGQLVIDGGSILSAWQNSTFTQHYLSADYAGFGVLVDIVPSDSGHPLLEGIEGPILLKRAPFPPDVLGVRAGAAVIFERGPDSVQGGQPAMLAYEDGDRRVIFAAFPLKELPSSVLEQLIDNALHWFQARVPLEPTS